MDPTTDSERHELVSTLDQVLRRVELTPVQYDKLETAYQSVGNWLAQSDHELLRSAQILPQGSVRLRTTVRPLGQDHFDVDLVCLLPNANPRHHDAGLIYKIVGDRLKEHGRYEKILMPKKRCWRLDYADGSRFHMDITPAMPNPRCAERGILVPDRDLRQLKSSNPVRYSELFDEVSKRLPLFSELKIASFSEAMARASIEPLPDPMQPKDMLRRIVQLLKRHRDIHFQNLDAHPPISIILTTLAAESYGVLSSGIFRGPWEFIEAVIVALPRYIRRSPEGSLEVMNPSAPEENFAEKWNEQPRKAQDFYDWHRSLMQDLEKYKREQGIDRQLPILRDRLVGLEAQDWHRAQTNVVHQARIGRLLHRIPIGGGLTTLASGSRVHANTFYGDRN